jgi:hypothetical protein
MASEPHASEPHASEPQHLFTFNGLTDNHHLYHNLRKTRLWQNLKDAVATLRRFAVWSPRVTHAPKLLSKKY